MIPLIGSGASSTTQEIDWSVTWYDSSMSVPETGLAFRLGTPSTTFTTSGMQGAANPSTYMESNSDPVFTDGSGNWKLGRTALVQNFWGSGALPGITKGRFHVLHWQGGLASDYSWYTDIQQSLSTFYLGFSGNGHIRVVYDGSTVLNTKLDPNAIKYTSLLTNLTAGTQVDIFYWQLGESWGGVVGKFVARQDTSVTTPSEQQWRDAPVISASLFPASTASPVTLERIREASITVNSPTEGRKLEFTVPLREPDSSLGWTMLTSPRRLQFTDGVVTRTLRRGTLIDFTGGFVGEQYPRFRGFIHDFEESDGIVTVECFSSDTKMAAVQVENYPDRISYSTFGYLDSDAVGEPVYNIQAYDFWPLEYAIQDLCYRGQMDPKLFFGIVPERGNSRKFNAKTLKGDRRVLLQRQANYGNAGLSFDSSKTSDDPYIYAPEISNSVLDWAREISEGYAFDFAADAAGDILLKKRANPSSVTILSGEGNSTVVNAEAYGATYESFTSPFNFNRTVSGARIDLVIGRRNDLGTVDFTVTRVSDSQQVATGTIDEFLSGEPNGIFFYDDRFTLDGSNAAVVTLFTGDYDTYTVNLTDNTGTVWILDSIFTYDFDPLTSAFPEVFLTDKAVLNLTTRSEAENIRNHIVVVGKRKAALTDSAKFSNVNNPQHEFFVSVGADPSSIWDQDSVNFYGGKVSTVIVDNKIGDQDYADWLAQVLLIRQRDPSPTPEISHTIIPNLEPRDPFQVADQRFSSITASTTVFVDGFTERYSVSEATTQIRATGYREIPSYEPREDLDLATLESQFGGNPVIGFNITYPSLDNVTITNPGPDLPEEISETVTGDGTVSSDGNGDYVPSLPSIGFAGNVWPPFPDSVRINISIRPPTSNAGAVTVRYSALKNSPYCKFTHVFNYGLERIHLPVEAGNQVANAYDRAGWGIDGATINYTYTGRPVNAPAAYSNQSPFYDPYLSELPDGLLITISFDALVSGFYRVSVWDARNDTASPTRVAWITEPGVDPDDPDAHWTWLNAGNHEFKWDAVDNIGLWNQRQSENYSWVARGVFSLAERPSIGKGFYAWNDQTSEIVAISDQVSSSKLIFEDDHYSQFYVLVESRSDVFASTTRPTRSVRSDNLRITNSENPQEEIYIYTHLPQPTKVKILTIQDWDFPAQGDYNTNPVEAGWVSVLAASQNIAPDRAASIRNGKPVRLTFQAIQRPGSRFTSSDETQFKLFRTAHLDVNILDQFMLFFNRPWYPGSVAEQKRLVNRRITNSEHTLVFADSDFRGGDTLSSNRWVFQPQDFKLGGNEELVFGDMLQFEDIPEFTNSPEIGETSSRFILGYMSYLFHLSAYIQDRSGRMVWCIWDGFNDESKIRNHSFATDFPEDLENYFRSTRITRQWVDPDYTSNLSTQWNIPAGNQKFVQFFHKRMDFDDTNAGDPLRIDSNGNFVNGDLITIYRDSHSDNSAVPQEPVWELDRQMGLLSVLNFLGDWTWEGSTLNPIGDSRDDDPLWIPCPSRDWFPFFQIPPMVRPLVGHHAYRVTERALGIPETVKEDITRFEIWMAVSNSMAATTSEMALTPGHNVEEATGGDGSLREARSSWFDYTRQQDWVVWEHVRGIMSHQGNVEVNEASKVIVRPTHKYYINTNRYNKLFVVNANDDNQNINVHHAQQDVNEEFNWTFRHVYNWESSSFFPVNERRNGALALEYLYPKWDRRPRPENITFDSGAWAGWKDEDGGTDDLKWFTEVRRTLVAPFEPLVGGTGDGDANIFLEQIPPIAVSSPLPSLATGTKTITSDLMVSMVLLNNRRRNPV